MLLEKYDKRDSIQDEHIFKKKRVYLWYSMLLYGMLCDAILCYGMEKMICYDISMTCYGISMLCYAMLQKISRAQLYDTPRYTDKIMIDKFFA